MSRTWGRSPRRESRPAEGRFLLALRLVLIAFLSATVLPRSAHAATLTGTVSWPSAPIPRPVNIAKDRHVCLGAQPIVEPYVQRDARGRVQGAIVWVDTAPAEAKPREAPVSIDQVGCVYTPVAVVTTVGSSLRISTSDPVLHNVHVLDSADRTVANWAMPVRGQEISLRLERPGELRLRCQAGHDWMRASVRVLDHSAYATTDAQGRFTIENAPAGLHRVVAWHPEVGRVESTLLIPASDARVQVDFALRDPKAGGAWDPTFMAPTGPVREKGVSHRDESPAAGPRSASK